MSKTRNKKDYGKFKSHFEVEVSDKLGKDNYEISELEYIVPAVKHLYTPDFTTVAQDGHNIYWELKGRIRNKAEADKYLYIKQSNPEIDLRFIIMDKKTLMPRSKKTTLFDWLKKNGFPVYVYPDIPNIKKL